MQEHGVITPRGFVVQSRPRRTPKPPPHLSKIKALTTGWQRLARDELADRIWQIQHLAAGQHLTEATWCIVDQMRQALRSTGSAPAPRTRRNGRSRRELFCAGPSR
jgi:hypothetical protein